MGPPGMGPGAPLPPGISVRQYVMRSIGLLSDHRGPAFALMLLSLSITALPFIVSATFGPLLQLISQAATQGGLERVWSLQGSIYSVSDPSSLTGMQAWLATPLSFGTILIIWALALVMQSVLSFFQAWLKAGLDAGLLDTVRRRVNDHIQSLSLDFFATGRTGALMQRVLQESMSVQRMLTDALLTPVSDLIVSALALAYLLSLSWQMTIISLTLAPLTLLMFRYTSSRLQQAAQRIAMTGRDISTELEQTVSGITDIQIFNAQPQRSRRFAAASELAARAAAGMSAWITLSNSGSAVFISLSTALVLLVGIQYGAAFGLTFASVIVFVQFVPNLYGPVQRMIASYTLFNAQIPSVVGTFQLLDTKPSVRERPGARNLGQVRGHIDFEDVSFGYSPSQQVLKGLSFSIREGETVALVGGIGSGKSTIFNLLLRFLEPQSGRIMLDGQDIAEVTHRSLREQVSKLSQFPFFLKESIRENVRMARTEASDRDVETACEEAHIHDVILDPSSMPDGYGTVVDVQIPSGGQKRLIALARCLLRRPEVLLLDEPTENLDADQRHRLVDVIRGYARNRTCLVISHDMDFIGQVADRVLVLKDGRIIEDGTHAELLERGGFYRTLYDLDNAEPLVREVVASSPIATGPMASGRGPSAAPLGTFPGGEPPGAFPGGPPPGVFPGGPPPGAFPGGPPPGTFPAGPPPGAFPAGPPPGAFPGGPPPGTFPGGPPPGAFPGGPPPGALPDGPPSGAVSGGPPSGAVPEEAPGGPDRPLNRAFREAPPPGAALNRPQPPGTPSSSPSTGDPGDDGAPPGSPKTQAPPPAQ
jgi:ABC-type multidrug transport system fused ATPase/permease subunit